MIIKAMIATTLISANQNSNSPKRETATIFNPNNKTKAIISGSHWGTLGAQYRTYMPIAVRSAMAIAIQQNQ